MDLGSRIKNLRIEHGMSQEQLASQLHVTRQTVSNWENNKNYPDFGTMVELSNMFQVSMDELIKSDRGYIKKQNIIEQKSITRRKWIIILLIVIVLITGAFCKYIYELGQGTEDSNRITSYTDIMMSVNLQGKTPSMAISKTYDGIEFENMSEDEQLEIMESVCGKIEGDIPSVYLDHRSSAEVELLFRHTDYYDIDPNVTEIQLYTAYGMPAEPQKRDDKTVNYTVESGRIHFNVCDFVSEEELVFAQEPGAFPEEKKIMDCIFVVKYKFGWNEYVSVTALGVLPDGEMNESLAKDIILDRYKGNAELNIDSVNVLAMDSLDIYQVVAFADESGTLAIQFLREENGTYAAELLNYDIEADETYAKEGFYGASLYVPETGKFYEAIFYKDEVKDFSLEFDYEDKEVSDERYIYYFSHEGVKGPAVFLVGETVKEGNFGVITDVIESGEV